MAGCPGTSRELFGAVLLGAVILALALVACSGERGEHTAPLSEVIRLAREGDLRRITVGSAGISCRQGSVPGEVGESGCPDEPA